MSFRKRAFILGSILMFVSAGTALAQETPPIIWTAPAHGQSVKSVAFAADGLTIVSASSAEARTWRASDGTALETYPDQGDGIISADISPDGGLVAVGYIVTDYASLGFVDLWDTATRVIRDTHGGCHVAFSPGGDIIASGGGGVNYTAALHDVTSGAALGGYYNTGGFINDVAYSSDGILIAVANSHNEVVLWDTQTETVVRTLTGHTDDVRCLAFSDDGQLIAAGAGGWDVPSDSTIKIWRVSDGALLRSLPGHGDWTATVAFHPGGEMLASSGRDSQAPYSASMRFWNVDDGTLMQEYDGLAPDIAFAPDGETWCYGTVDGSLVLAGSAASSVRDEMRNTHAAAAVRLEQNVPNPFNPRTTISFELAVSGPADLRVYSVSGRHITTLFAGPLPEGRHRFAWDGRDAAGHRAASGAYFYRLRIRDHSETRRMTLMK